MEVVVECEGQFDTAVVEATSTVDGPTDAAGALAPGSPIPRARAGGLDAEAALERNDSHPFFRALGDLLGTGPTGTNVMDVQLVLVGAR
jgi:glycerate 2-kinase